MGALVEREVVIGLDPGPGAGLEAGVADNDRVVAVDREVGRVGGGAAEAVAETDGGVEPDPDVVPAAVEVGGVADAVAVAWAQRPVGSMRAVPGRFVGAGGGGALRRIGAVEGEQVDSLSRPAGRSAANGWSGHSRRLTTRSGPCFVETVVRFHEAELEQLI